MSVRLVSATTGLTVYAVITRLSDGKVWNTSGTPAFETYDEGNWTDYAVALAEQGASGRYVFDLLAVLTAAGDYDVEFRSTSGTADPGDDVVDAGVFSIDGSGALVSLGAPASITFEIDEIRGE